MPSDSSPPFLHSVKAVWHTALGYHRQTDGQVKRDLGVGGHCKRLAQA